jgi:hypothetical protein
MNKIQREPTNSKLVILENNMIKIVDYLEFEKNLSLDGLIRLHTPDFLEVKNNKYTKMMHFNLQFGGHIVGKTYGLIEILETGYFISNTNYKEPILNPNNVIKCRCIWSQNYVQYEELENFSFEHSLSTIKNIDSLKKVITERYSVSMPKLSQAEILNLGVGITLLEIIG